MINVSIVVGNGASRFSVAVRAESIQRENRASGMSMAVVHMAQAEDSSYRGNPPRGPPQDLSPQGSKIEIFRRNDAEERMETYV
jgi:hypothetical protein